MNKLKINLLLLLLYPLFAGAKEVNLSSPNKVLHVVVTAEKNVSMQVLHKENVLFTVRDI